MTKEHQGGPKVPTERPDPKAAARDPGPGAEDRPGFDLGGKVGDASTAGSDTVPGGPKGSASQGTTGTGRASGLTNPAGSRQSGGGSGGNGA